MANNRFFSNKQEKKVAKAIGGKKTANSGATLFDKGDVKDDHILIECKTLTKVQKSHTIKREWLDKNREEALAVRRPLSALAFDFGDGKNFYILNEDDFLTLYNAWKELEE